MVSLDTDIPSNLSSNLGMGKSTHTGAPSIIDNSTKSGQSCYWLTLTSACKDVDGSSGFRSTHSENSGDPLENSGITLSDGKGDEKLRAPLLKKRPLNKN